MSFIHAQATRIDRQRKQVETAKGTHAYGCLVIATGYLEDFSPIPGAGPGGPPTRITSLQGAVEAADGWEWLLANPHGPVVAATQGTGCSAPPMEAAATSPLGSPQELVTDSGRGSAGG